MADKNNSKDTPVFIPDDVRAGSYANIATVAATENEVIVSFLQQDMTGTTMVSKIFMSPAHTEALIRTLDKTIAQLKELKAKGKTKKGKK